ncbi:MAG: hypothetical protein R2708_04925 [Vicinamibacterales bacterium]
MSFRVPQLPWRALGAVVVVAALAGGCDDSSSPTAPTTAAAIPPGLTAVLEQALHDEYLAETIYQGVIADFGQVLPFVNILTAEERHSASIARLYTARALAPPANPYTVATVTHYPTITAACAAGVAAERANIALYDALLTGDLPADVRQVFTNNRAASADNHLPAFLRCS